MIDPPCSEAFLVEGVTNFLTEGGKKTHRVGELCCEKLVV